ncbi:MAG: SPASM domain-containing protein [bacterium]|nr:SPASM domain-containing protein [bacterium]
MRNIRTDAPWSDRGTVHLFEKFDKKFVLDAGSGVVIELDEVAFAVCKELNEGKTPEQINGQLSGKFGEEVVKGALKELTDFYREGDLFSNDPMQILPERTGANVASLCLIISEDCNLRCDYCFTHGGTYGGERRLMAEDVAKDAMDFIMEASGPIKSLSFSYFGGEPLLNLPVIEKTTDYAIGKARQYGKSVRFNITTNATILDERARDFYASHPEVSALISIDGGAEINDRHRKFADKKGSFDVISRNIRAFADDRRVGPKRFSVRGTYSALNHSFTRAVDELVEMGLTEISVEPAIVQKSELEIKEEHLPSIFEEYDKLAGFYLDSIKNGRPFSFFHFQHAIDHVARAEPMFNPCGAGIGYLAVAADGLLYPCHRFVGDEDFLMGNIWDGITDYQLYDLFGKVSINLKKDCRDCWAKYHCGGGCHRHCAEFNGGDIHKPHKIECELMKYRIELGAYLYASLTDEEMNTIRETLPENVERRPEFKSGT